MDTATIHLNDYVGDAILPWIDALAELRIRVFRDYPYIYEGSREYEEQYLKHFSNSPQSLIVMAFDGDKVIGASTAMPMLDFGYGVAELFQEHGYDPTKIFYFGESVLDRAYRGKGIGVSFFEHREAHAKRLGYTTVAFCGVERPENHPLKPADYVPLDAFWQHRGYTKHPELVTHFEWQDLNEDHETAKPLVFWMKELT